jgi:hypothetical protein
MKRIKYAFTMFWLAFTKPALLQHDMFPLLESLFKFLAETAKQERPMTADFGFQPIAKINWDGEKLLTLWCGYAEKDNPLTRLQELAKENAELRRKLATPPSQQVNH